MDVEPDGQDDGAAAALALEARREAIAELGEALREIFQQATATEVGTEDLRRAAAQIRAATEPLGAQQRKRPDLPSADNLLRGVRLYNPVSGPGNPMAPPLRVTVLEQGVIATCTLGLAYEGPPTFVHGGVSALLLDQLLGHAAGASGHPGMTVNLTTRYRAPVPLQTPLHLAAQVTDVSGRKITAEGFIATAAEPDQPLVEATGLFIGIQLAQAQRLFGGVPHPDATNPAAAHD
jgi:hypothetical protein